MKQALLLAAVVLALGVSSAQAAPFTPRLNYAYALAERYWGGGPIGCESLDREIVPEGDLENAWAQATLTSPTEMRTCNLLVDRYVAKPVNFILACTVFAHEMGHLRGFDHSPEIGNIMSVKPKPPGICWREGLRLTRGLG